MLTLVVRMAAWVVVVVVVLVDVLRQHPPRAVSVLETWQGIFVC